MIYRVLAILKRGHYEDYRQRLLVLASILMGLCACSSSEAPMISEAMKQELEKYVSGLACMPTRAFPLEETPDSRCYECDKLVDAGLVEKESIEGEGESNISSDSIRYYLTDIGEGAYDPGTDSLGPNGPRFCFGAPRLVQITGTFGPVMLGGSKNYGIRFLVQLDNPIPICLTRAPNNWESSSPPPEWPESRCFILNKTSQR